MRHILSALCLAATLGSPASLRAQDAGEQAARAAAMRPRSGDRVALKVFDGDASISDVATLDETGSIMLPKIGLIQASTLPIAALRDTIRSRLARYYRDAAVEVSVLRRVVVSGEVARPGVYYAELTTSVGEIVSQAGGLRESGHPRKVYLVRGEQRTRLSNWQSDRSPGADLQSGDQVVVGRRTWLELNLIPVVSVGTSVVALVISLRR